MSGSLEWVTCPVCEYGSACADSEDGVEKVYYAGCGYASEHGLVFHFFYRREFRITVIAKNIEEAIIKAQTGGWSNVTLIPEALHYDMLEIDSTLSRTSS